MRHLDYDANDITMNAGSSCFFNTVDPLSEKLFDIIITGIQLLLCIFMIGGGRCLQ